MLVQMTLRNMPAGEGGGGWGGTPKPGRSSSMACRLKSVSCSSNCEGST